MVDDLDTRVYQYIAECGSVTLAAIVGGLGENAELVSETITHLLDTHFVIVVGVNTDDEPLYAFAAD